MVSSVISEADWVDVENPFQGSDIHITACCVFIGIVHSPKKWKLPVFSLFATLQ